MTHITRYIDPEVRFVAGDVITRVRSKLQSGRIQMRIAYVEQTYFVAEMFLLPTALSLLQDLESTDPAAVRLRALIASRAAVREQRLLQTANDWFRAMWFSRSRKHRMVVTEDGLYQFFDNVDITQPPPEKSVRVAVNGVVKNKSRYELPKVPVRPVCSLIKPTLQVSSAGVTVVTEAPVISLRRRPELEHHETPRWSLGGEGLRERNRQYDQG